MHLKIRFKMAILKRSYMKKGKGKQLLTLAFLACIYASFAMELTNRGCDSLRLFRCVFGVWGVCVGFSG